VVDLGNEKLIEMFRRMLRIRYFDERALDLRAAGEIVGFLHGTQGEEAEVVAACMALRRDDYMTGTHRSHGHPIGKGADLKGLMAELYGKRTGVCKGKGGSAHLADFSVGSLGESGIVGSAIPVATGAGLSAQTRGTDQVTLCFFGDGASNEGAFHESLNLAAIWKLPVIYLCENNQYAVTTPVTYSVSVPNIADRASAYGIPGIVVDGQNPITVYEVVSHAVARARVGEGPTLIEAKTYRFREHTEGMDDVAHLYRTKHEISEWQGRDPVVTFPAYLVAHGVLSQAEVAMIDAEVRDEIDAAIEYARQSPFPDPEELVTDLYANPIPIAV
jgi:pyruvate dehydrogenase E1 component alpha subunit